MGSAAELPNVDNLAQDALNLKEAYRFKEQANACYSHKDFAFVFSSRFFWLPDDCNNCVHFWKCIGRAAARSGEPKQIPGIHYCLIRNLMRFLLLYPVLLLHFFRDCQC